MEYRLLGSDSILKEIGSVVIQAASKGNTELNNDEQEFVMKLTKRMVKEYKRQLADLKK